MRQATASLRLNWFASMQNGPACPSSAWRTMSASKNSRLASCAPAVWIDATLTDRTRTDHVIELRMVPSGLSCRPMLRSGYNCLCRGTRTAGRRPHDYGSPCKQAFDRGRDPEQPAILPVAGNQHQSDRQPARARRRAWFRASVRRAHYGVAALAARFARQRGARQRKRDRTEIEEIGDRGIAKDQRILGG